MTGLFTGSSARKGRKRERRAVRQGHEAGSEPHTGIKPPNAAVNSPVQTMRRLGPAKTPLSP